MIEHVLMIAFLSLGIHSITREGMIFGFWEKLCYKENEKLISELLNAYSECFSCMVSFWGVYYFWGIGYIDNLTLIHFNVIFSCLVTIDNICDVPRFTKFGYLILLLSVIANSTMPLIMIVSIICAGGVNFAVSRLEQ